MASDTVELRELVKILLVLPIWKMFFTDFLKLGGKNNLGSLLVVLILIVAAMARKLDIILRWSGKELPKLVVDLLLVLPFTISIDGTT